MAVPKSGGELPHAALKKTPVVLAIVLLFAATASMAMSLGRNRGAVLVGRPLDISVQAVLEAQEDPANLCLDADVFYGDNKIDKSRIRVSAAKASSGALDALIGVRVETVVDEPVVTVYMRAGCLQRSEKRFVMLADVVSEPAGQPMAAVVPPMVTAPATPAVPAPSSGSTARQPSAAAQGEGSSQATAPFASASSARAVRRAKAAAAAQSASSTQGDIRSRPAAAASASDAPVAASATRPERAKAAKAEAKAGKDNKARLKLEPLDLTIDRDPTLRASPEMLSTPAANEQERSVAAALWRALNAQPQDILKDAEKLQSLEASVRDLRNQTLKNQQAIGELNAQLQKAQAERYANMLVYALGILLLLALAAIGWLWHKRSKRDVESDELPWWRKNKALEKGWANSLHDSQLSSPPSITPQKPKAQPATDSELDLDLGLDNSVYTEVKHMSGHGDQDSLPPLSRRDKADFASSIMSTPRALKAEELFDVQQQADFFVSLGQHEQAIEVLRGHIADNGPTSALVYMDLFNLYHQLGRRDDYDALREEFNKLFNARMPAFDVYTDASPGLESYEAAMTRIEALWPSPKVLDIIEESIFRKPDANAKPFDLEAYRELLLLYAVAREIISPEANKNDSLLSFDLPDSTLGAMDSKTVKFMATAIQPLSASVREEGHEETTPVVVSVLPRPSPRLGLDIDLSELAGEDEVADSGAEPESDSQFFAQFVASLPESGSAPAPVLKTDEDPGNLIDFEAFGAPDATDSGKKPPQF